MCLYAHALYTDILCTGINGTEPNNTNTNTYTCAFSCIQQYIYEWKAKRKTHRPISIENRGRCSQLDSVCAMKKGNTEKLENFIWIFKKMRTRDRHKHVSDFLFNLYEQVRCIHFTRLIRTVHIWVGSKVFVFHMWNTYRVYICVCVSWM